MQFASSAADAAKPKIQSLADVTKYLADQARDAYSAQLQLEGSFLSIAGAAADHASRSRF